MMNVGVLGATGYTAQVLIEILLRHPRVNIVALGSRRDEPVALGEIHPSLESRLPIEITNLDADGLANAGVECAFCCLPHAAAATAVDELMQRRIAVVDLSADFRLWDATIYQHWYGAHPCPQHLGQVPYGLPEWFRGRIAGAKVVANPGCYPTSAILAMAPLLQAGVIDVDSIILDSKSGVSGAGRTPSMATLFPECNESLSAYKIGEHRHAPEITQILSHCAGAPVQLIFTPHLVPMDRGILTTGYARCRKKLTTDNVIDLLSERYADEPFVRVVRRLPATKHTVGTNFCDLTARIVNDHVITVSCIDNLMKGASGAAVQNMNVMFGWDESLGLL